MSLSFFRRILLAMASFLNCVEYAAPDLPEPDGGDLECSWANAADPTLARPGRAQLREAQGMNHQGSASLREVMPFNPPPGLIGLLLSELGYGGWDKNEAIDIHSSINSFIHSFIYYFFHFLFLSLNNFSFTHSCDYSCIIHSSNIYVFLYI